jgi:hypothetical protein
MDIVKLLRNGESETVEFKARFNKETIVSLAAFANTKGDIGKFLEFNEKTKELRGATLDSCWREIRDPHGMLAFLEQLNKSELAYG